MKISGFTYIRNGISLGYPFVQSIMSVLPLCDEVVVAVGDSSDGTREAIQQIGAEKIKIIDTVWDMNLRTGGKIFAQQANVALDHISGDWAVHIQSDEVIHEKDIEKIRAAMHRYDGDNEVEGFIQPFLHFWGSYHYLRTSRRMHRYEIRVFRNSKYIRSYRDSQGFRIFSDKEKYDSGESGRKLRVVKLDAPIFHYNAVRPPMLMESKFNSFNSFYDGGANANIVSDFNHQKVDKLERFDGVHPAVMQTMVDGMDWRFEYDPSKAEWQKKKDKYLQPIEDFLGIRFGEYKNYKLLKGK